MSKFILEKLFVFAGTLHPPNSVIKKMQKNGYGPIQQEDFRILLAILHFHLDPA